MNFEKEEIYKKVKKDCILGGIKSNMLYINKDIFIWILL